MKEKGHSRSVSWSLCASILLHMAIIGGGLLASYHFYTAGGLSESAKEIPVYITVVQDIETPTPTPEIMQQKTAEADKTDTPPVIIPKRNEGIKEKQDKPETNNQETLITQPKFRSSPMSPQRAEASISVYSGGGAAEIRYQDQVRAIIDSHRIYPRSARRRHLEGEAVIQIHINRDGQITGTSFVRSTGHHVLDQAVLEMVQASDPLPPMPQDIKGHSINLEIPIGFKLK